MKQLPKKKIVKKKRKGTSHKEGKFWCNCLTKNIRKWLGLKRWGKDESSL